MRILALATLFLAIAFAGCSTLKVYHEPSGISLDKPNKDRETKKLKGLPFYSKRIVRKQETVWQVRSYDVSVTYTITYGTTEGAPSVTSPITFLRIPLPAYDDVIRPIRARIDAINASDAAAAEKALALLRADAQTAHEALAGLEKDYFKEVSGFGQLPTAKNLLLISNTTTLTSVLDETGRLYVNGARPLYGPAAVNFTLSGDQTLTNATASVESKTFEQLSNVLPIKDYLSKSLKLVKPTDSSEDTKQQNSFSALTESAEGAKAAHGALLAYAGTPRGRVVGTLTVKLAAEPHTTTYVLKKELSSSGGRAVIANPLSIENLTAGIEFSMSDEAEKPRTDDAAKAFQFSGKVVPPKAE
jgi:hypothetical protein